MFKIGDEVKVIRTKLSTRSNYMVGKVGKIIKISPSGTYPYVVDTVHSWVFAEDQLQLIKKENIMSDNKKYYKVAQDTPAWKKGAILEDDGDGGYKAINDLWDNVEDMGSYTETKRVVENNEDFYTRVYAMGKAQKMVFVTKEKAQEMASKFFTGE